MICLLVNALCLASLSSCRFFFHHDFQKKDLYSQTEEPKEQGLPHLIAPPENNLDEPSSSGFFRSYPLNKTEKDLLRSLNLSFFEGKERVSPYLTSTEVHEALSAIQDHLTKKQLLANPNICSEEVKPTAIISQCQTLNTFLKCADQILESKEKTAEHQHDNEVPSKWLGCFLEESQLLTLCKTSLSEELMKEPHERPITPGFLSKTTAIILNCLIDLH